MAAARVLVLSIGALLTWTSVAVRPASDEEAVALQSTGTATNTSIMSGSFLYMATGQAMWFTIHEDGPLDQHGVKRVTEKVKGAASGHVAYMSELQEVWVAPTRAAIQTAILAVGKGWKAGGLSSPFPRLAIKGFLRPFGPKVGRKPFQLKKEGTVKDVEEFAKKQGKAIFDNEDKFAGWITSVKTAFPHTGSFWDFGDPNPHSAVDVYTNIHKLKSQLCKKSTDERVGKILVIADYEYGNYLFMPALPYQPKSVKQSKRGGYQAQEDEDPEAVMRSLVRERLPSLKQGALVKATWKAETFHAAGGLAPNDFYGGLTVPYLASVDIDDDDLDTTVSERNLHTIPVDDSNWALFEMQILPPGGPLAFEGARFHSFNMMKRKHKYGSWKGWKERRVGVSFWMDSGSTNKGFMNWASPFGDSPLGFLPTGSAQLDYLPPQMLTVTSETSGERWQITATGAVVEGLVNLVKAARMELVE
eukprot:CAMPEP_0178446456 /NCGR_PEP_ID=MMETSP0689_2-20121128/40815_1 /TAXON_ID=160604 /ORGANISM="Amphidinium massartii, Strain CS-259" /LENGTH=474 /DNA_ID=CAMNT_0020071285 /DNA_START=87 /DNA_END=1508 /DNA_ORIENTATION=-